MQWVSRTESGGVRTFYHPMTQEIVSISPEAAYIYDKLILGLSPATIAEHISDDYDVNPHDVLEDVLSTKLSLTSVGLLEDPNRQLSSAETRDIVKNPLDGYEVPIAPFRLFVTLTRTCNLECVHCYNQSGPTIHESLEYSRVEELIREASELGIFEVILSGGEPFVYPHLGELLETARSKVGVSIVSNGTLIERNLPLLREFPPSRLQISIDGDQFAHDAIRGSGSYRRAIAGAALAQPVVPTTVGYTVTHLTTLDSIERLCRDLRANGIETLNINRLLKTGRAQELDSSLVDPQEVKLLAESQSLKCNIEDEAGTTVGLFHCGAGVSIMSVKSDGRVYPCSYLQMCKSQGIGSIYSSSLKELWDHSNMESFRAKNKEFTGLSGCLCDALISEANDR